VQISVAYYLNGPQSIIKLNKINSMLRNKADVE